MPAAPVDGPVVAAVVGPVVAAAVGGCEDAALELVAPEDVVGDGVTGV